MTASAPPLAKLIGDAIEAYAGGLHSCMPAVVTAYNATNQSCTVQPVIRQGYLDESGNRVAERLPAIVGVPVVFPGSGGYSITWPVSVGDFVLLNFSEVSIDQWLALGGTDVDPGTDHHHAITDAIAIPGLRAFATALGSSAHDSSAMVLSAPSIKLGDSSASSAVLTTLDAGSLKTWLDTHTHTAAGSPTSVPIVLSPSLTGATKVKAV